MNPTSSSLLRPVLRGIMSLALLLPSGMKLTAATLYWEATPNGTWSTTSTQLNWSPTSGGSGSTTWTDNSDAVIQSSNPSITIGQSGALTVNAASLTVQNGATFIGATNPRVLNVAGGISGNFTVNGATVTINANGAANYTGTLTIQSGGFVANNTGATGTGSQILLNGGNFSLGAAITGNTVTIGSLAGTGGSVSPNAGGSAGTRTLEINQATNTTFSGTFLAGTSSRVLAITKSGTGTLTLNGANAHGGQTLVSAGSLVLAAENTLAAATGDLVVNGATAVLGTSVTNANIGGNFTLTSGTLKLNDTNAGTLTLASGKDFAMSGGSLQLTLGTAFDQISSASAGDFLITGGTLVLDISGAGFSYTNSYAILAGFSSGSVANLSITGYDTAQYSAVLGNNGILTFTAVPEPTTATLLVLAALGSLYGIRRRRCKERELRPCIAR